MKKFILTLLLVSLAKSAFADDTQFKQLRDEALQDIGWVAGNSSQHEVWDQIKDYVGEGGAYYNVLTKVAPKGSDPNAETEASISTYREWFKKGQQASYDEDDNASRVERVNQIVKELSAELKNAQ